MNQRIREKNQRIFRAGCTYNRKRLTKDAGPELGVSST